MVGRAGAARAPRFGHPDPSIPGADGLWVMRGFFDSTEVSQIRGMVDKITAGNAVMGVTPRVPLRAGGGATARASSGTSTIPVDACSPFSPTRASIPPWPGHPRPSPVDPRHGPVDVARLSRIEAEAQNGNASAARAEAEARAEAGGGA